MWNSEVARSEVWSFSFFLVLQIMELMASGTRPRSRPRAWGTWCGREPAGDLPSGDCTFPLVVLFFGFLFGFVGALCEIGMEEGVEVFVREFFSLWAIAKCEERPRKSM